MSGGVHHEMVAAAAGGDDAALAELVRLYHDRVYRFGRRVCRDDFDADDAVQEAFTQLAVRRDVIGDPGALSWLMTVVRNACLRLLRPFAQRRRALGEASPADEVACENDSPERALERFELVGRVHSAIAGLSEPYRGVLILRDLEGLSGEETCRALGIDLAAMKTRLHRARAHLRAALQPSEGPV
ncbi:MAG TPA: RNA polymerase sigma factor [Polyangiaceae bacterium]|nr:RNA polymerase sigma factor [Polyangiaceae bacterium]